MWQLFFVAALFCSIAAQAQMVPAQVVNTNNDKAANAQSERTSIPDSESAELRVTLQADRVNAYVGEQILVTLEVSAPAIAFNITGEELALNNIDVIPVNRQSSTTDIDGKPYQYSKTVFALFAREQGAVNIPALTFNAVLPMSAKGVKKGKGNPAITASSRELQLSIKSAPVAESSWFPAQNVEVASSWSLNKTESDEVRAGEPITRHLAIHVSGQHPGAVPTFKPVQQSNLKFYPDTAKMQTDVAINGLNGTLTQTYAIVASIPGNMTLPPIDINWWHIDEQEWKTTTLPEEQLQVVASELGEAPAGLFQPRHYRYILAGLVAIILGLTIACIALWRRIRLLRVQRVPDKINTHRTERDAWLTLQKNIRQKNFAGIRQSLIPWASLRWPHYNIRRLEQIPLHDQSMYQELMTLDDYLYSRETSQVPDLVCINKGLRKLRKNKITDKAPQVEMSGLYPDSYQESA